MAHTTNFADRLLDAIDTKGGAPICVGIDPVHERLPAGMRAKEPTDASRAAAIERWCGELLEVVAPVTPAVKPQVAYFEQYRAPGVAAYYNVVRKARQLGLVVIGDVKRNDIGSTAAAYAAGHLSAGDDADAVTVNGYLGQDGIQPFIDAGAAGGRGLFVLVRTSNPSGAYVQDFADASGRKLYEHVAAMVASLGDAAGCVGARGFSSVGAVVGATYPAEAARLRELMPRQIFLVPGYGAQGATAADCRAAFDAAGSGAIVNASRSVIYAYGKDDKADWKKVVLAAARAFAHDIRGALK